MKKNLMRAVRAALLVCVMASACYADGGIETPPAAEPGGGGIETPPAAQSGDGSVIEELLIIAGLLLPGI